MFLVNIIHMSIQILVSCAKVVPKETAIRVLSMTKK